MRQKLNGYDMLSEEIVKISEFSEFSILTYTQNPKIGNLGKCSLTSNFDSSCNLSCKNDKNLTETNAQRSRYAFRSKIENLQSLRVFSLALYPK